MNPRPHPVWLSVLLHLGPGAAAAAAYFALVPVVAAWGLPSVAALALSAPVAVAPVQLTVLALHRRATGQPAVSLRARPRPWVLVRWVAVALLAGAAAFVVMAPLSARVESAAFGWWPAAWELDLGTDGGFSRPAMLVTGLLLLVCTVVVAPVVEELYFRGFLLPRMPQRFGRAAPVMHAALFAGYHLWTPWLFLTRVVAILPLVYAVRRTRSVRVGIVAHVVLNTVDLIAVVVAVLAM